jgi:hypothetical protein
VAGEFIHSSDSANTLYFLVYRISDGYIYDVGDTAFEAVGTWNDARVDECDIAMTGIGDAHKGVFPAVAAGVYFVQVRIRAGGSPDTDDRPDGQGVMYWDGTAAIDIYTIDTTINDDIIGTAGDTLEDLSDEIADVAADVTQLILDQNKVLNVVDETEAKPSLQITVE